jgi:tripartite-type tricarboxylate transporter receptor subunit TctC
MNKSAILMAALLVAAPALAQYPSKPIRIVVAIAAGGAPDLAARTIGQKLVKSLGQPVVVENRAGANGNLAGQYVAQSPADGYTLLLTPDSLAVINKFIYKNLGFDPGKDLVAVATVLRNQFVLVINPSIPATTLKEFLEYARKSPKPIAYASAGNGSQNHLLMELLKARAGIDMLHVPYKGGAPAAAATVAGDTLATIGGGPSTAPHVRAGKLRLIAGTAARRWELTPDVPVIGELYPGYEGIVWSAIFAPSATPGAIVLRLNGAVNAAQAEDDYRQLLAKSGGSQPYILSLEEAAALIRRDSEKYSKVVADLKLTAEE